MAPRALSLLVSLLTLWGGAGAVWAAPPAAVAVEAAPDVPSETPLSSPTAEAEEEAVHWARPSASATAAPSRLTRVTGGFVDWIGVTPTPPPER